MTWMCTFYFECPGLTAAEVLYQLSGWGLTGGTLTATHGLWRGLVSEAWRLEVCGGGTPGWFQDMTTLAQKMREAWGQYSVLIVKQPISGELVEGE